MKDKKKDNSDILIRYILLFSIISLIFWLVMEHTGKECYQINPSFWAGAALPILIQLVRKVFDLRKNGK